MIDKKLYWNHANTGMNHAFVMKKGLVEVGALSLCGDAEHPPEIHTLDVFARCPPCLRRSGLQYSLGRMPGNDAVPEMFVVLDQRGFPCTDPMPEDEAEALKGRLNDNTPPSSPNY